MYTGKKIMITGGAGFIGSHLASKLTRHNEVLVVDNFNSFCYDKDLKIARSQLLNCSVYVADLRYRTQVKELFKFFKPDIVIHLAAYVGVRHSMDHPYEYIKNNIIGTQNLIDACQDHDVEKVIYASTSCVMAGNDLPWIEHEKVGHQLNAYGYTKRTNECQFMTSFIPQTIGLRFFTVYGPWGRPDMALFTFTDRILQGKPIAIFNHGNMKRDFTYIDDIISGIEIVIDRLVNLNEPKHEIYNIGRGEQVDLMDFVTEIEKHFGKTEHIMLPKHPADTKETWSDTHKLQALGWRPTTSIPEGVANFAEWYKGYYQETKRSAR